MTAPAALLAALFGAGTAGRAAQPAIAAEHAGAAQPWVASSRLAAGTYRAVDAATKRPLRLGNELIVRTSATGSLHFTLNAVRALDLNSGTIEGLIIDKLPSTFASNSPNGKCRLHFAAIRDGLTIRQDIAFGDCGFGYGVLADGLYVRTGR